MKRVSRVIKARGAKLFQAGDLHCAERQWSGALLLLLKVGLGWPAASELYVQLKCNLAMLYIKSERWAEARQATSAALEVDGRLRLLRTGRQLWRKLGPTLGVA